ncbi:MAG: sigma-70 family RNA polymerase sigma factor [Beijerinckiaceae bacterium]|nr:sigma-70 family RNA polymerase sigma factor [Beijerinckiaceae bacterium]
MSNPSARPDAAAPHIASSFKTGLLAEIPHLRAFAASLCGSLTLADDLAQETLLKAWAHAGSFLAGTNLRAWLFTILRNSYYTHHRRYGREIADTDGLHAAQVAVQANQEFHMDLLDFRRALLALPLEQREALIMVGAMGLSHEEAAVICAVAPGTIKSRVSRGRTRLAGLLGLASCDLPEMGETAPHRTSPLAAR